MRSAALMALLFLATSARAAVEVPLQVHGSALIVEATLDGRFTGRFLLDTGATYCVVSKETARKAKIKGRTGGQTVQLMTASGPLDATLGEARRVDVGGAVARDVDVAVVDEEPVPELDGILGLSFLRHFRYTVDSKEAVLRLDR